ncbi:MAG: HAD family phosphatase [Clostridia bacterium]|nr:HAD family phosphatase [Clostridia bacterium]
MTKLVLSDLDGTLLKKGESQINHILLNLIKSFSQKGIVFAVSSGRSYREMRYIMRGTDDIYYACSDGAAIVFNDEVIFEKCIEPFAQKRMKDKKNIIFHSVDFAYYNEADEEVINLLKEKYGEKAQKIEDTDNLKRIIKISKYGAGYIETPPFSYEVYKDKDWCEWINNNAGKGKATEFIQKRLNISIRETAAFGDNYNDVGMLQRAAEKYVMDCAPPSVKMIANHRVSDIERELNNILKG